jgi:hypothetical protein
MVVVGIDAGIGGLGYLVLMGSIRGRSGVGRLGVTDRAAGITVRY